MKRRQNLLCGGSFRRTGRRLILSQHGDGDAPVLRQTLAARLHNLLSRHLDGQLRQRVGLLQQRLHLRRNVQMVHHEGAGL